MAAAPVPPSTSNMRSSSQRLTTVDALTYLREVKTRFHDQKDIYDTFLEIMKEFKAARVDTAGVIVRVKELFKGHRELILGFNTFLPKGYEIEMPLHEEEEQKPVEFDQAINYVNKIKMRFAMDERVYKAFLEILNMYRKGQKTIINVYEEVAKLFKNHSDLLHEFTYFLPDSTPPSAQPRQRVTGRRTVEGPSHRGQRQEAARQPAKRRGVRRDDDADDDSMYARTHMQRELTFFEKVKAKLRSREGYQDFLKCLNLYTQEVISKSELTSLVHDLIGRYSDLAVGFNEFLARCEHLDLESDGKQQGKVTIKDIARMKQQSLDEKLLTRPISELDVSSWERCSTSYVKLPSNYPPMSCQGRTPQQAAVLNDQWVSVTSGSEDYSFKHMRKNQYEEALFRVEDDRFELDMVIENNAAAMRAMFRLNAELESLNDKPAEKERWTPKPGALSATHLRAAYRIYGDHGTQIVELLTKSPQVAIPVVCARLQQKDAEWRATKAAMAPLWQKVYDANYHKSLDHRSFYFKQTDKKSLGAKSMLNDIREIADKRRNEDDGLLAVSAAADFSSRLHADLTYDFKDRDVHEDVYIILRDACKEMMTADVATKTLAFYTGLVEHFFSLDKRALEKVDAEAAAAEDVAAAASPKKMAKHKRLAMISADGGGGDTDTDMCAEEEAIAANDVGAAILMDVVAGAAEAVGETEAEASPAADTGAASGDALSGVSSDQAVTDKADAEGPMSQARPESEASDDDPSDEDTATYSDSRYKCCRPLAAIERSGCFSAGRAAAVAADASVGITSTFHTEGASKADSSTAPQRVFYGNDTYYIFFRLHQHLYDRLRVAHTCSHKKQGYLAKGSSGETDHKSPAEYKSTHNKFMQLVKDLIVGDLDASAYEDACRTLLGTGSYVLFTLEKLIYKVVKQMQLIAQDGLTNSLLNLYRYENARGTIPPCDATYFANAHVLLHDDSCFRMAAFPDGAMTMQMMGPDKSEVPAAIVAPEFASYLKNFVDTAARPVDGAKKVFLLRNFPSAVRNNSLPVAPPVDGAELTNGLECKLNCSTSKVSYVLDTEDVFRRHCTTPRSMPPEVARHKAKRFQSWADAQQRKFELQHQQLQAQLAYPPAPMSAF